MTQTAPHISPFNLLREVRDVLSASDAPQARLNKLVKKIASGFESEVCSIYFSNSGKTLELYATCGLSQEAVHHTKLKFGQGLVGEVAKLGIPLNLQEAQEHPNFVFVPNIGEEKFHSFCGVPINYHHRVIGVLVVQSVQPRTYSDEQIEVLQTVAMVLAELAVACSVVDIQQVTGEETEKTGSHYFTGLKISPGLAMASAVLHRPTIEIKQFVSENPKHEEERLHGAMKTLQESIEEIIHNADLSSDDARHEIIDTYRMFTHDRGWLERIVEAIHSGLTAEAAVKKVQERMHMRMSQVSSVYLRDKMQDLEDLSTRLLYHLAGISPTAAHSQLPDQFILVAQSIGPAELLEYSGKKLKGVILEEGSTTSHVAIIARMMDIPVIARIPSADSLVKSGDLTIIDGENGEVYIRPPQDVIDAISEHIIRRQVRDADYVARANLAAVTKDEVKISLNLNIGLYLDAEQLNRPDVDGIGLYRTELPYLASSDLPDVDEQRKIYGEVFRYAHGKPVVFRSFDIGGDKQVPYLQAGAEENPAMGWRATRVGLDRPVILRRQFRALIRAAGGHVLYVMFPFIADISEFDETKQLFDRELERAKVEGLTLPKDVEVGSMIEIPSILFQLPALLSRVDFVSVGSNDLLQFLYACDRGSERLSGRYDPLTPVFLKIVKDIAAQCDKAGVEMGFCGAMASKPIEALALIGSGVRNLSVPPPSVGPIKDMIRSLNCKEVTELMNKLSNKQDHSVRAKLETFAKEREISL